MNRGLKAVIGIFSGFLISFLIYTIVWSVFGEAIAGSDHRAAWYVLLICLVLPTACTAASAAYEVYYLQHLLRLAWTIVLMALCVNSAVSVFLFLCRILDSILPGFLTVLLQVCTMLAAASGPAWYIVDHVSRRDI